MSAATGASAIEKNEASAEAQEENLTEVVDRYSPLVKRIAHHLLLRMPASVQIDDLIQSGMIGLLEAAKKYDCLLYTSPSPRDATLSRMPSSA